MNCPVAGADAPDAELVWVYVDLEREYQVDLFRIETNAAFFFQAQNLQVNNRSFFFF